MPKVIREKLGLKEEDIVGFHEEDCKIILKKIVGCLTFHEMSD